MPLASHAQSYPARSITVVVPFPAGGPSDVVARIVTEHMGRTLGQQMVIENVGGAGGTLGSARVAAAQPDGYTSLAGEMGFARGRASADAERQVRYSARDFEPIGLTAHSPAVIVARKDFPAKNLSELWAYLKQNGDNVKTGTRRHWLILADGLPRCSTKPQTSARRLWAIVVPLRDERSGWRARRFPVRTIGERAEQVAAGNG